MTCPCAPRSGLFSRRSSWGFFCSFSICPDRSFGGLWLVALLVTLWRDYRRPPPGVPFSLVINLLKGQAVVLWLAVLMTLLGWGRLSILVCVAYAAVAVCVQQAVGFMRLMNRIAQHMPQQGAKALLSGFLLALALPRASRAGHGCHGSVDTGLSGRRVSADPFGQHGREHRQDLLQHAPDAPYHQRLLRHPLLYFRRPLLYRRSPSARHSS